LEFKVNHQIQLEYSLLSLLSIALQQTPWQINDHVEFMPEGTAESAEVDPTAFEHVPGKKEKRRQNDEVSR
jgi:hypothetical protein